jgi:hypothetical protein
MIKLAIYFSDNDYVNTFLPFLKYLAICFEDFDLTDFDQNDFRSKTKLYELIRECLPAFYLLNQVRQPFIPCDRYNGFVDYVGNTLDISDLYLGNEVDSVLQDSTIAGNSELFVMYGNQA